MATWWWNHKCHRIVLVSERLKELLEQFPCFLFCRSWMFPGIKVEGMTVEVLARRREVVCRAHNMMVASGERFCFCTLCMNVAQQ